MKPTPQPAPKHDDDALLALLWMASPTLPIGGFSYSEGLEAAVDAGLVHDENSAAEWLCDQLWLTQARSDLVVLAQALRAWRASDFERLQELDHWVRLTRESAELRLQSEQMGRSLMEWVKSLRLPPRPPEGLPQALEFPTYPVAFAYGLWLRLPPTAPVRAGVLCAAFAWAENMVQAAIKALPLGQGAGQRVLARVCLSIPQAVTEALQTSDAQRQSFSPMWAILSARHETQYSRLFRS